MQARIHVTEKKLPVADVAARLGVSTLGIYTWIKRYSKPDGSVHVCQDRLKQRRPRGSSATSMTAVSDRKLV